MTDSDYCGDDLAWGEFADWCGANDTEQLAAEEAYPTDSNDRRIYLLALILEGHE